MLPLLRRVLPTSAIILTLHRFQNEETNTVGHSAAALRKNLAYLRRQKYRILSLPELFDRVAEGTVESEPSVAFTVDDGYSDFHSVAAPIFAEFDCPVTVFLPTGFLDGQLWLWWDVLEYAFSATSHRSTAISLSSGERRYTWREDAERLACARDLAELLERVSDDERKSVLQLVPAALEVAISDVPPPAFAPMSWAEVRKDARRGVTFGPHTVSHPILSQLSADQVREEIATSWRRVREETDAAIPVFAIPNGQPHAFGSRDVLLASDAGMRGCVSTIPGYLRRGKYSANATCLPRFPYQDDMPHFVQLVTGLEGAKSVLRDAVARLRTKSPTLQELSVSRRTARRQTGAGIRGQTRDHPKVSFIIAWSPDIPLSAILVRDLHSACARSGRELVIVTQRSERLLGTSRVQIITAGADADLGSMRTRVPGHARAPVVGHHTGPFQ